MTDVALDELPGVPGARVRRVAALPAELDGGTRCTAWAQARAGVVLYDIPGVARMRITDGCLVEICPLSTGKEALIEQFLHGTARAVLVHQRGGLPLHGACLMPPGGSRAIALAGVSGAGKSTLAAELLRRGWSLLGDDVTPLYQTEDEVVAWPSRPGVKLWNDACQALTIDAAELPRVPGERDKYVLPAATRAEPAPLALIFLLAWGEPDNLSRVEGSRLLGALTAATFKPHYVPAMGCAASFLSMASFVATTITCQILTSSGPVNRRADLVAGACGGSFE
jgi:hypothetical protein